MLSKLFGFGGRDSSAWRTRNDGPGSRRAPLVVIISVRLDTRFGWRTASCCATMPPIDAPQTCAFATPRVSSRPAVSSAMSASV